jgi:hypothetical protein
MGSIYVALDYVRGMSGKGKKIRLFHVKKLDFFRENRHDNNSARRGYKQRRKPTAKGAK